MAHLKEVGLSIPRGSSWSTMGSTLLSRHMSGSSGLKTLCVQGNREPL